MAQEIIFTGNELEFLMKMDQLGCVLTDDGKFYCDPEKNGLSYGSRVPVIIKGSYVPGDGGWKLTYWVVPAKKTIGIGILFLATLLCCLIIGSYSSAGLFCILSIALVVNYVPQNKECLKRFATVFRK